VLGYDKAENISSAVRFRIHPIDKVPSYHKGVDIAAPRGNQLLGQKEIVKEVGRNDIFGLYVLVESGLYSI